MLARIGSNEGTPVDCLSRALWGEGKPAPGAGTTAYRVASLTPASGAEATRERCRSKNPTAGPLKLFAS